MAKFQKISENSRKGIEEALVIAIVESFRKEKTIREDGTELYRYEVVLKNINFVNVMSDELQAYHHISLLSFDYFIPKSSYFINIITIFFSSHRL